LVRVDDNLKVLVKHVRSLTVSLHVANDTQLGAPYDVWDSDMAEEDVEEKFQEWLQAMYNLEEERGSNE